MDDANEIIIYAAFSDTSVIYEEVTRIRAVVDSALEDQISSAIDDVIRSGCTSPPLTPHLQYISSLPNHT